MAMVKDEIDDKGPSSSQGARGAQFALQVALQTMKERCQQLQRRLTTIEDENIALRRIVSRQGADDRVSSGPESLQEQVAVLSLQKAQLSQQMQMVAAENRQLWLRLSKLYQTNQSLGSHLSKISDTLKQHSTSSIITENHEGSTSLEEISLKLANSILQEKLDLEQQCAEMTELQSSSSPIDLQTLAAEGDESEALNIHYKRLAEVRDLLRGHQSALRAGIQALRSAEVRHEELEEQRALSSLQDWGDSVPIVPMPVSVPDWTCPMCGKYLPAATVAFESFSKHVSDHFAPEPDENLMGTFDFIN